MIWLGVLIAYGVGLWGYSVPLTGDQKVYLATAVEMMQHDSWLIPWLGGVHAYIKPPLVHWAVLGGWNIFGFNPFGTFFPGALVVAFGAWVTHRLSEKMGLVRGACNAGLWFAVTMGTLTYGGAIQMEVWIVLFYGAAWLFALRYLDTGRLGQLLGAFIFAGLLAMLKSPLHSVFWVAGFVAYLFLVGRATLLLRGHFWFSLAIGIAVGTAWFVVVWLLDGETFWKYYVVRETLNKRGGNGGPLWDMWRDFGFSLFPILIPALAAVGIAVMRPWGFGRLWKLVLAWSLFPAVFFSVFPYRTETYLYFLTPALALLLDAVASGAERSRFFGWVLRLNGLLIALATLAIALLFALPGFVPWFYALGIAGAGSLAAWFGWRYRPRLHLFALLGLVAAIRLAAISLGESDVQGLRAYLASHPKARPIFLDDTRNEWHEFGLLSVASRKPGIRVYSVQESIAHLRQGHVLVVGNEDVERVSRELRAVVAPREGLETVPWLRWNRGFMMPRLSDLVSMADKHSPEWDKKFRREFALMSLRGAQPIP